MTNESAIDFSSLARVQLSAIELAYLEKGKGPLVLCLHGFPDNATTWLATMDVLAAQGYRVVAPFTRGYYPSSTAADGDYTVKALAQDVLELIEHFAQADANGQKRAIVIGHDWGALAAYAAANLAPEKISKLVVAGVPHVHKTPFTLAQLFRSWYILFFQLPALPEWAVGRNQLRFIDFLYDSWAPEWTASTAHLDSVKASLSGAGSLQAALGYYRCMVRRFDKAFWEKLSQPTTVPALVFAGRVDGSTGHELFRYSRECYTNLYEQVDMPGVGHFPHLENPEWFARKVLAFLQQN